MSEPAAKRQRTHVSDACLRVGNHAWALVCTFLPPTQLASVCRTLHRASTLLKTDARGSVTLCRDTDVNALCASPWRARFARVTSRNVCLTDDALARILALPNLRDLRCQADMDAAPQLSAQLTTLHITISGATEAHVARLFHGASRAPRLADVALEVDTWSDAFDLFGLVNCQHITALSLSSYDSPYQEVTMYQADAIKQLKSLRSLTLKLRMDRAVQEAIVHLPVEEMCAQFDVALTPHLANVHWDVCVSMSNWSHVPFQQIPTLTDVRTSLRCFGGFLDVNIPDCPRMHTLCIQDFFGKELDDQFLGSLLRHMPNLRRLVCARPVSARAFLQHVPQLEFLALYCVNVRVIDAISSLRVLQTLELKVPFGCKWTHRFPLRSKQQPHLVCVLDATGRCFSSL